MPVTTALKKEGVGLPKPVDFYSKQMLSIGFRERFNPKITGDHMGASCK